MRTHSRTRALFVVALGALAVGVAGTSAFGTTSGRHFSSTPNSARFGHVPNTLDNHSISQCPTAGQAVSVSLMQGTTTLASASTSSDAKGRWAVTMSIPTNLKPGTYAVLATCTGATPLSYKAQNFRVIPPQCPTGTTTTPTSVPCRVPPSSTSSTA